MTVRPLAGIKVLDFTTLLPGPLGALILAEAGAEVIKIERPEGEDMRHFLPRWGGQSVFFALLNRGKRNIALDLKDARAVAALEPLLAEADVLIEQFRPGVMDRLGLGYERCRELNPRLVYCSISGYGQEGPRAQVAGHDLNYIADTGLLSLAPGSPDRPGVPPALIADIGGGTLPAVVNILLALLARERTGAGTRLDIAMCDAMFMFGYWAIGQGLAAGAWPLPGGEMLTGGSPRYQLYPTSDGRLVAAAPLEQRFWTNFCALIELDEAYRNDFNDPQASIQAVHEIIAARPSDHWREIFAGKDCCCTIVATVAEALEDPHFRQRGLFSRTLGDGKGGSVPAVAVPVAPQFRGPPGEERVSAALGADNDLLGGREGV